MMILTREQYNRIMEAIDGLTPEELVERFNITPQIAYSLYAQNIIRYVKRNHHRIKRLSPRLYEEWKRGKSILSIAREKRFPPTLIAGFILKEHGMRRSEIQRIFLNPETCNNRRIARELKEALGKDRVYAPELNTGRSIEGKKGEARLESYLKRHGIEYYTEYDLRNREEYPRTPDILFKKEENIRGYVVNWIESKSNFGSPPEFRSNYRKQLSPYTELFGTGIVVYWYGYVEGVNKDPSIYVVEGEFFND